MWSLARLSSLYLLLAVPISLFLDGLRTLLLLYKESSRNQYLAAVTAANAAIGFGAAVSLYTRVADR